MVTQSEVLFLAVISFVINDNKLFFALGFMSMNYLNELKLTKLDFSSFETSMQSL